MGNFPADEKFDDTQKLEILGQLTGGIAHDFNNLLTVIRSNAEILQEELKDDAVLQQADLILKAAKRGAGLVQRLLAFARKQELRPQFVDTNAAIDSLVNLLRHAIE